MYNYNELGQLMERIIHKYNQVEKKKRCYGSDTPLSRAEIHTIAAVGDDSGINITTLAKRQGITKGAASQMIYKLIDKGFIIKRVSPHSDTEVCLSLTEQGKVAYDSHTKHHETTNERFFSVLKDIPDDIGSKMEEVLREFDQALDERLSQK